MTQLALILALAAVTYPTRALPLLLPGLDRLPRRLREFLRLLAPATLAALATTAAFAPGGSLRLGPEPAAVAIGVALVVWRRNLLLGIAASTVSVALARQLGL